MPQRISLMGVIQGSLSSHRFAGLLLIKSLPAARAVFSPRFWQLLPVSPPAGTLSHVLEPASQLPNPAPARSGLRPVHRTLFSAAPAARLSDHPKATSCPREPGSPRVLFLPTRPDRLRGPRQRPSRSPSRGPAQLNIFRC